MTEATLVRRPLVHRALFEVLKEAGGPTAPKDVIASVSARVELTPNERSLNGSGLPRFESFLRWTSAHASAIGWLSKRGGWAITDAGVAAMTDYPGDELLAEQRRRYGQYNKAKRQPTAAYRDQRGATVAAAVSLVEPGWWTSYNDLGDLAGLNAQSVGNFMASQSFSNAHRVLRSDGKISEGFTWDDPERCDDPQVVLLSEGVEVDANGVADPARRLRAENLAELLEEVGDIPAETSRRAWLVRGSSVEGRDLVPVWLTKASMSLAAGNLRPISPPVAKEELEAAVEEDYAHKTYSVRSTRLAEFDAFCNKMRAGDYVLTTSQGKAYFGRIVGDAVSVPSSDNRSNLRRPVEWLNRTGPVPFARLPQPLPARLHSQAEVVELTENLAAIEDLLGKLGIADAEPEEDVKRELAFPEITTELADELFAGREWLQDVTDVLWDRRQLIFYGPPGTGKTFLARKLAEHLAEPSAVKLVQFHPSYTYEDFFEGFRPVPRANGQLAFELRPGPFRLLVESARENPSEPHVLIIDEINRANLAKVFGELYFLLEYRDDAIALLYSPESEFTMPPNVFVIGTMNTTDRSIALVDAAMRRRFGFIELHPDLPPTSGLLAAWLGRHQAEEEAELHNLDAPELLDALNEQIEERDLAVGPSYLMRSSIYRDERGLERVWETAILPLIEELHYGAAPELIDRYRLQRLRKTLKVRQARDTSEDASPA